LVEKKLKTLNALDPAADRAVQNATVERYLGDKHFRVVARAATLAGSAPCMSAYRTSRALMPAFWWNP
jgi:hypothetical protein